MTNQQIEVFVPSTPTSSPPRRPEKPASGLAAEFESAIQFRSTRPGQCSPGDPEVLKKIDERRHTGEIPAEDADVLKSAPIPQRRT